MSFTSLKNLPLKESLAPGHRLCDGCGIPHVVRYALKAVDDHSVVIVNATGCLEVCTTPYPYTSWRVPYVHTLFGNTGAVASGIVETIEKLSSEKRSQYFDVIVFAGDGGTFDIGLQALSGALERGHDFLYICYDNEAYMNTGNQRSSATPMYSRTTTSYAGKAIPGKLERKKDIIGIVVAHGIKYAATASISHWRDYMTKVRKGVEVKGPAFIHVLQPCQTGWRYDPALTIKMAKMAVDANVFPLIEVEKGKYKITYRPPKKILVADYLKPQRRFAHLFLPENDHLIRQIQQYVDQNWERLNKLEKFSETG
ncbi:MAG: pyruvate ferredoxin oxidoreductase [Nitrososphaerales archaeon]|nr:pyruvate ferredoxin oxidoreductase [Nitrososphaerales archaeon]